MAAKTKGNPRKRVMFVAGRLQARKRHCTHAVHVGPFTSRPDLRAWYIELGIEDVTEVVDCGRCGSSITMPARAA